MGLENRTEKLRAVLPDRNMGDRKMNSEVARAVRQVPWQGKHIIAVKGGIVGTLGMDCPFRENSQQIVSGQKRLAPLVILGEPYCPDGIG